MRVLGTEIKTRTYFSIKHIMSAALFSRLSYDIENNPLDRNSSESRSKHDAYVIGAVFAATGFLEATINELIADVEENSVDIIDKIEPTKRRLLKLKLNNKPSIA